MTCILKFKYVERLFNLIVYSHTHMFELHHSILFVCWHEKVKCKRWQLRFFFSPEKNAQMQHLLKRTEGLESCHWQNGFESCHTHTIRKCHIKKEISQEHGIQKDIRSTERNNIRFSEKLLFSIKKKAVPKRFNLWFPLKCHTGFNV